MAIPRFYCPNLTEHTEFLLLDDEATHATKSLRMKEGDLLIAFDGQGWQATARVRSIRRKEVCCLASDRKLLPGELPGEVTLAIALQKGDRQRLIVERLVELGIHRMIPLHTARSVAEGTDGALARLRRYSIEACKQSGRNRNLEIAEGVNLQSYLQSHIGREANGKSIQWVAHPYPFESQTKEEALSPPERASSLSMIVGPEGGLTDSEVLEAIEAGWQCLNLGPRILRVETAVSYLAALANYWLEPPKILSQG